MNAHAGTNEAAANGELRAAVRQVVQGALAHVSSQRQWSAEEVLAQLPVCDHSFHCYELVRQMESLICCSLSPLVASSLSPEEESHTTTAAEVTEKILSSSQYRELCHSVTSGLRNTVEDMLDDPTHLLLSPAHLHPPSSLSQTTQYFSLDGSFSSELSQLLGQTALWSPEQLEAIADDLSPSQPPEVRTEAMHHLLQFPVGDLVAMDSWSQLKPMLSDTLMDSDPNIAGMSLTLHSHLLFTHTPTSSLEALLSLTHQLSTFFLGKEGVAVTTAMGIDPADDRSLIVLQRMNLLNRFQREVASYWVRYGTKTVEEIVSATFDLLLLGNDTDQLCPIHYLSLLDPKAEWLREWTLQATVHHLMSCQPHQPRPSHTKQNPGYYNESSLHYLQFCHCLSLFGRVVKWKVGRTLFPIPTKRHTFSISDVLVHLIHILYFLPPSPPVTSDPVDHTHHVTSINSAHLILSVLEGLATSSGQLLTHSKVFTSLLSPIQSMVDNEGAESDVSMETLTRVGQIVSRLACTERGRSLLLGSEDLLSGMCGFVKLGLVADTPPATPVVTTTWLFACRQLYKTGAGLVAMEKYQLHAHIADKILKIGIEEVKGQFGGHGYQFGPELVENLLGFCWRGRGMGSLGSFPRLLEVCVEYICGRMKRDLQVSWCDRHGYGSIVSELASTHVGAAPVIKSGLVAALLEEVVKCGEGEGEERLVAPWTHPLDTNDHALNKTLSPLLSIISNFPVMYELSTSETTPTLISWLLGNGDSCSPSHQSSSQTYQLIRSRVISMVTTSLDMLILLEDKYKLLETLLRQQRAVAMENGTVVLDESSVITNRTLVAGHLVGGPFERLLPPLSLSLPHEEYPWPLVTDYPLPPCFHGNTSWKLDLDKDSALYKFMIGDHAQSRDQEGAWLRELREVFCDEVRERGSLSNDLVAMVLEGVARTHPLMRSGDEAQPHGSLSPPSHTAVQMIIRYGEQLGLLSPSLSYITSLTALLKPHPHNKPGPAHHPGFDWLTAISFLLTRGNVERALHISQLLHKVIQPSAIFETSHVVELILQTEAPQLAAALQLSGCAVVQATTHWLRQVFLNYLDWPQIILLLATTVVMGTNYQAYWCVGYLRSREAAILLHSQCGDLLPHLLEYSTEDFPTGHWLGYMRQLDLRFRSHDSHMS